MNDHHDPTRAFILFGALRSGTSLLRLMLNAHPKITCPSEMDFLVDHLNADGHYDLAELRADRIYRAHEALYPKNPLPNPTPQSLVDRIAGQGGDLAGIILHRNLSEALAQFESIPVVHLVRDPRDVARSSLGMGWAGHVYYGVDHWIDTISDWKAAMPALPEDRRLVVAYEELIKAPQETLAAICTFVGLPFDPAMLTYDSGSSYGKPDPSLTTQWKRKQSAHEVGLVEGKIGDLLQEAGYDASGFPIIKPGPIQRTWIWLRHKQRQWSWRIDRYGLFDPIFANSVERLGLPQLGRKARARMEATKIENLK